MSNRAAILTKVHKILKKHYKPVTAEERSLVEHMLYASVLENARPDAADEAFAKLQELFFDWNEVRVTTVTELTEVLSCLPDSAEGALRLKTTLQAVFETHYSFDLELLKKQALGKAEKELQKLGNVSPFVLSYTIQQALGGHSIPINQGSLDILYAVGVVNDSEADKRQVPGLERAIPKTKGKEFGSLIQQLGADFRASPGSSKLKAILAEIDSGFKERLAARQAYLENLAQKQSAEASAARAAARAEKAEAAESAKTEKSSKKGTKPPATPAASAKKPTKKAAKSETPAETSKTKKAATPKKGTKGLAKRKPR